MEAEPDRFVARYGAFGNITDALGLAGLRQLVDHRHDVAGVPGEQGFDTAFCQPFLGPAINADTHRLIDDPDLQSFGLETTGDGDFDDHFMTAERHLFEFDDGLIDGQAVARFGVDRFDHAVPFGAQHIFHLHGFDDGQFLSAFDFLSGGHGQRHQQPRHG